MIVKYSNESLQRWTRGQLQVRLDVPGRELPMGYCDGTDDDERELRAIAEAEGVESLPIHKKLLKTGRQIWTVGSPPVDEASDD